MKKGFGTVALEKGQGSKKSKEDCPLAASPVPTDGNKGHRWWRKDGIRWWCICFPDHALPRRRLQF